MSGHGKQTHQIIDVGNFGQVNLRHDGFGVLRWMLNLLGWLTENWELDVLWVFELFEIVKAVFVFFFGCMLAEISKAIIRLFFLGFIEISETIIFFYLLHINNLSLSILGKRRKVAK